MAVQVRSASNVSSSEEEHPAYARKMEVRVLRYVKGPTRPQKLSKIGDVGKWCNFDQVSALVSFIIISRRLVVQICSSPVGSLGLSIDN